MRRRWTRLLVAVLSVALLTVCGVTVRSAEAPALVPLPEYVTFVHSGVLEQVLAGDDAATVLVDPASLPAEEPIFPAPLEVVAHWWAPDGAHVLVGVRSTVTEARRLFICDHNGANPVQVLAGTGTVTEYGDVYYTEWDNPVPVWSPDGQSIALTVFSGVPFGDIYVVSLDGTGDIVGSGIEPAWSPDGAQIAYCRTVPEAVDTVSARPYVTVGTLDAGSVDLGLGRTPVFSPDGTEVLYRTWTESGGEGGDSEQLAIAPASGGTERRLTAYGPMDDMGGPAQIAQHGFSPDGSKVYYLLGRRSDSRYVYELASDGSYAAPVAVSGLATEFACSLDGSKLVYTGGSVHEASYQTRQQVFGRELASCAEWRLTPDELVDYTCFGLSVSHQNRYVAFEAIVWPVGSLPSSATAREVWVATLDGAHAWRCATDAWDAASQPMYAPVVTDGDLGPADDEYDPSGTGFWDRLGDALASFFEWLAGFFG